MHYHQFRAMNTSILAGARGDSQRIQAGFGEVEHFIRTQEARFTRFSEDSELCDLNRSNGDWFLASPDLYEVVHLAYQAYFDTGGLFNPAVLAALEYAGYDHSLEIPGIDFPTPADPNPSAIVIPDFGATRFDPQRKAVHLPLGLRIDLGGIAKGWIAEQAAYLLASYAPSCVVDAGGDLFLIGTPSGDQPWMVGIEDPFTPARDIASLHMKAGAVATSAITKRRWQKAGQVRHHLIDPRTGLPAEAFWVSVTVVAPHTTDAEVLAKALLIAGPADAPALVSRHPDAIYLAVDKNRQLWGSANSNEVIDAKPLFA